MSEKRLHGVWEYERKEEQEVWITGYYGDEIDIAIPEEIDGAAVTQIDGRVFMNKNITSIKIPDTVEFIGLEAFAHCEKLVSVELPKSIEIISEASFEGCKSLVSINIPDSAAIYLDTFEGCCKLVDEQGFSIVKNCLYGYYGDEEKVEIPEQVKFIGTSAFENNKNLKSVIFPETLAYIAKKAFLNCINLSSLEFQCYDDTPKVGPYAFKNCPQLADNNGFIIINQKLCDYLGEKSDVTVPEGVIGIGYGAFSDNSSLVSVTMPESVEDIEMHAFENCPNLSFVRMPKRIPPFDEDVFHNCPNIVDDDGFITIGNGTGRTAPDC